MGRAAFLCRPIYYDGRKRRQFVVLLIHDFPLTIVLYFVITNKGRQLNGGNGFEQERKYHNRFKWE